MNYLECSLVVVVEFDRTIEHGDSLRRRVRSFVSIHNHADLKHKQHL